MHRARPVLLLTLAACAAAPRPDVGASERDRAAVLPVVQGLFDVMVSPDVKAAQHLFVPEGVWVTVRTLDGARSHTGTDAFCPLRTAEAWRLAGGVYSVER